MARYNEDNLQKKNGLSNRAKVGIVLFSIAFCLFFVAVTTFLPWFHNFLLGSFGLAIYPILLVLMCVGIILMLKKKYYVAKLYIAVVSILFFVIVLFFQIILTEFNVTFGMYLSNCYNAHNTVGGVIGGIFAYILYLGLDKVGTIMFLAIVVVICVAFVIDHFLKLKEYKDVEERSFGFSFIKFKKKQKPIETETKSKSKITKQSCKVNETTYEEEKSEKEKEEAPKITLNSVEEKKERAKRSLFERSSFKDEDDLAVKIFGEDFIKSIKDTRKTKHHEEKPKSFTLNELYEEKKAEEALVLANNNETKSRFVHVDEKPTIYSSNLDFEDSNFNVIESKIETDKDIEDESVKENNSDIIQEFKSVKPTFEEYEEEEQEEEDEEFEEPKQNQNPNEIDLSDMSDIIIEDSEDSFDEEEEEDEIKEEPVFNIPKAYLKQQTQEEIVKEEPRKKKISNAAYVKPSLNFLTTKSSKIENDEKVYQEKAIILEETLESFKIPAKVMGITCGPAVTRYELEMPVGIPVKRITQHSDDIRMRMESKGGVRIETPIPGRSLVGVEIPNSKVATIGLRDILESPQFLESKGNLTFALGKDIAGDCKVCNLETMPHLLVAGSTGSGKSVCLNVLLISLLYRLGPNDLKLILIDPKRVEFVIYNYLPHMLVPKAINDSKEALNALDWVIKEMMRRYDVFSERNVRNFKEYNASKDVLNGTEEKLPYIVVVIDELADLMTLAGRDLEEKIQRLTQLARAAGIHLIIATQRPSVDVITGVIKSNLPSRIAFAVTDFASSKTILDKGGAEKLLGRGDMLYSPQDLPEPIRIQCPFVDSKEVFDIVEFIKKNNEAYFDESISSYISKGEQSVQSGTSTSDTSGNGGWDPLLPQVLLEFIQAGGASASMIQRKHSVGFSRAGRIIDQMETAGFISARDPGKQTRSVLISLEKYREIFEEDE